MNEFPSNSTCGLKSVNVVPQYNIIYVKPLYAQSAMRVFLVSCRKINYRPSIIPQSVRDLNILVWYLGWRVFTRGQFWPLGIVVACICVCESVCLCVNLLLVRAITRDLFKLGSPNLDKRCKRPWLRSLYASEVVSARAWIICVLSKNNSVSGDKKPRNSCYSAILKRLVW